MSLSMLVNIDQVSKSNQSISIDIYWNSLLINSSRHVCLFDNFTLTNYNSVTYPCCLAGKTNCPSYKESKSPSALLPEQIVYVDIIPSLKYVSGVFTFYDEFYFLAFICNEIKK